MAVDTERMIRVYVKMRDARSKLKKEYDEADGRIKEQQEAISNALLGFLNENNMSSMRTEAGTVYKEDKMIPQGADWEAFYAWVKQEDAFDFLEKRITRIAVSKYMEANDGKLPPGVSVYRTVTANVRRNS